MLPITLLHIRAPEPKLDVGPSQVVADDVTQTSRPVAKTFIKPTASLTPTNPPWESSASRWDLLLRHLVRGSGGGFVAD